VQLAILTTDDAPAASRAVLDRIAADLGSLTCLVNNAGVSSLVRGDMLDLTPGEFRSLGCDQHARHVLPDAGSRASDARG